MTILNYDCGLKLHMIPSHKRDRVVAEQIYNHFIAYAYDYFNKCKKLIFKKGKDGYPYITNETSTLTLTYIEFLKLNNTIG